MRDRIERGAIGILLVLVLLVMAANHVREAKREVMAECEACDGPCITWPVEYLIE